MLIKLIKNEFKETYKVCLILLVFMSVITLLGCLSFQSPIWSRAFFGRNDIKMTIFDVMAIFSLFLYVLAIVGGIWGLIIYMGYRFYRSMYSEEGYLTHTLPVTSHQLLASKILVGGFWQLLFLLFIIISVLALVASLVSVAISSITNGMNIFEFLKTYEDQILMGIRSELGDIGMLFGSARNFILYGTLLVVGSFCTMAMLAGAITIGQLSGKHKVMMSIVTYFGIMILMQVISSVLTIPLTVTDTIQYFEGINFSLNFDSIMPPSYFVSNGVSIIVSVILYLFSNHIINQKLNLE